MSNDFFGDSLFNALERNEPAPGMLLVSAPGLLSFEFQRSVVLILEHDEDFSFGVDLTRRSDLAVANVIPEWAEAVSNPPTLYLGGPLQPQSVVGLGVTKNGIDIEARPRLTKLANRLVHVDLRAEPEEIKESLEGFRLFAGYAQWDGGQLEEEILRGDWYVAPALPGDVVVPARTDLWSEVLRRQPLPLPLFSTFPRSTVDS